MTVGNNIKKYREANGYTRKEFAELISRTYNTLRCYECEKCNHEFKFKILRSIDKNFYLRKNSLK